MIKVIRAKDRFFSDFGWLKTHWLFSFSDYYDPENIQFGALRVFNDDMVAPGTGFPTHPHREMEIITIVLDGEITHEDSMGNITTIKTGDIQRMTAGKGLTHSEYNLADKSVHFYQIWIYPDKNNLEPGYDQKRFHESSWKNWLCPVASGRAIENVVTFNTDATIFRGELDANKRLEFNPEENRRIFIYLIRGEMLVNDKKLLKNDQARIDLEKSIILNPLRESELILIDIPSCKGWGYSKKVLKGSTKSDNI